MSQRAPTRLANKTVTEQEDVIGLAASDAKANN
jgi:hypothetical protein